MRNIKNARKCEYSPLEDRRLLAVNSVLEGNTLTIYGDAIANTVEVSQSGSYLNLSGDISEQYSASGVSLIRFYGAAGDDFFENFTSINTLAVGHDGNDTLRTGNGTDQLYGGDGDDILVSTGGNDRLFGNDGRDEMFGGPGDDTLYGLGDDDELYGEAGNDLLVAGFGDDTVYGGTGEDLVYGHFGADRIFGGGDNDRLFGQDDDDFIQGDNGNDVVRGGRGSDTLNGNGGDDRILGDEEGDTINAGGDNDIVYGGSGDDTIRGGDGNDLLFANNGDDNVYGQAGNDVIRGNDGNDILDGGDNADRIAGDDGDDYITGGGANDTVLGDAGADTIVADSNDRAIGGAGNDTLQLSDLSSDTAVYSGNYSNYVVTQSGTRLVVHDRTGADGQDIVTGADSLQFADSTRAAEAQVTKRVYVQPVVVSNTNGANTAEFFGSATQEFDVKRTIDEIFLQAAIDIEWLTTKTTNNSFFNYGNGTGTRTQSDLNAIVTQGDNAGIGSSNSIVIDMYFVNRVPGFQELSANSANGLAFVGGSGITMHTGENLLTSTSGRKIVGRVGAHEIAHNLGLSHVNDSTNLMDDGDQLYSSQVSTMRNSSLTQNI